jgi:hypothetical protein
MSSDPVEFFFTQAIAFARSLPLSQAVLFLRGMLQSCSDSPATDQVRRIYVGLSESDRQLWLIESGQLKLDLRKLPPTGDGEQGDRQGNH